MARRYYCDYCDKSFIDDLEARKKHLQSSFHTKLRNMHYEYYRDPRIILKEELEKTPCRRFLMNGLCQFSGMCKYTHFTPEQLWELRLQLEYYERNKRITIPTVESWLETFSEKHSKDNSDVMHIPWSYPPNLEQRTDLPPSIRRMRPEHFYHDNCEEWGK